MNIINTIKKIEYMEPIRITAEELEYLTSVPEETLNEANDPSLLTHEEFLRETQDCITLEEFGKMWKEHIRKVIPNP